MNAYGSWAESGYQSDDGLQIGKNHARDDSSQDADLGYQFNNVHFIEFNNIGCIDSDDIFIFPETPEGMQTLLDMVQEFTTWCGMEINIEKNFLLVIDKDQKRRETCAGKSACRHQTWG